MEIQICLAKTRISFFLNKVQISAKKI